VEEHLKMASQAGADMVLPKPFDNGELIQQVNVIFST